MQIKISKRIEVAVKAMILNEQSLLVVKRSDDDDYEAVNFDLPGGRIFYKEAPVLALRREVLEETGLDVDVITPTRTWNLIKSNGTQIVGITFLCKTNQFEVKLSKEHKRFMWIRLDSELNTEIPNWLKTEIECLKNLTISF